MGLGVGRGGVGVGWDEGGVERDELEVVSPPYSAAIGCDSLLYSAAS